MVAIDITLDGLSQYIAEHKVSPNTLSYVLDQDGRVLAASDLSKTYTADKGKVDLRHISDLENELPALAYGAHPRNGGGTLYSFTYDGHEYFASLSTLPADFGKRWQLFIVTPVADFTGAYDRNNQLLLTVGIVATLMALVVIYFLSGMLSAPLERLAAKVTMIEKMDGEPLPLVRSKVREIDVLARAIDTLDSAVKSFAAFVPVGLVRELLTTDAKTQLGGHSRFLTIMFSDLEDFSSLSERIPTQALLQRVSRHLELVIQLDQPGARHDRQVHGRRRDGLLGRAGAARGPCLARLRRGAAHPARHGRAERAVAGRGPRAAARAHRHPLRRRAGRQHRLARAHELHRAGRRRERRGAAGGHEQGVPHHASASATPPSGRPARDSACGRSTRSTVKGRRGLVPIYELLGAYGAGPDLEPSPQALRLAELTRTAYAALLRRDNACALAGLSRGALRVSGRSGGAGHGEARLAERDERRIRDGIARACEGAAPQRIHLGADPGAAERAGEWCGADEVLEIGSGSGVVLAVLGALGAGSVCGIDIEEDAIEASSRLLARLGHDNAEFLQGDMWRPVTGRRFDLIVANLPNFSASAGVDLRPPAELERRRSRRTEAGRCLHRRPGGASRAGRPRADDPQLLHRASTARARPRPRTACPATCACRSWSTCRRRSSPS